MNEWVERSIEVAKSPGYLDKLTEIYPATILPRRPLEANIKREILQLYDKKDWESLLKLLLRLTKRKHPFPIEHPYASIFRQKRTLIETNPETFKKLGEIILSMPIEDIIKGCERPADINRVMGSAFQSWLKRFFPTQGIPVLSEQKFEIYQNLCFLDARNEAILDYVDRKLSIKLGRGRDFLAKVGDKYVVGEARFLSTSGGSQTRDLRETISFVRSLRGKVSAIGVMDGIVWFHKKYVEMLAELGEDEVILTALLLKDFLKCFG